MLTNVEKYEQGVGYVVKRLVCIEKNRPVSQRTVTTRSEELIVLKKYSREIIDCVGKTYTALQPNQKRNLMSFLSWWFGREYPKQVESFLNKLGTYDTEGYVASPTCPVHQLAKVFDTGKFGGQATKRAVEIRLAFSAINMFLSGKKGTLAPASILQMWGKKHVLNVEFA